MQIAFKTVVQQQEINDEPSLYVDIPREEKAFYGSLMRAWMDVNDNSYRVAPLDMTTHLVVQLPDELITAEGLKLGSDLEGSIRSKEFKELRAPQDLLDALAQSNVSFDILKPPQQRQGITFINEAQKGSEIRTNRINKMVKTCQTVASKQPQRAPGE